MHDKSHNLDIEGKELLLRIIFLSVLWHIPNIMAIQDVVNHGYTDFFSLLRMNCYDLFGKILEGFPLAFFTVVNSESSFF